jgi:Domain of unknown function (DUF303).
MQQGAIIENGPSNWQILQADKGFAEIHLDGYWMHPEILINPKVFARIVKEDTGDIIIPWSLCEGFGGNKWKITVDNVPIGGLYRVETCLNPDGNKNIEWAYRGDLIRHIGVGDLYVMAGQSNIAGYGRDPIFDPLEIGVHILKNDGEWDIASHPLNDATNTIHEANRENYNTGHSPCLSFAKHLKKELGYPIGLIQVSRGGSRLCEWNPDEDGILYENMKMIIKKNGNAVKGILWYQGCGDAEVDGLGDTYFERFSNFISYLRKDLDNEEIPILTVQLNRYTSAFTSGSDKNWGKIREAQRQAALKINNLFIIPSIDCKLSDSIHNSSSADIMLGERLAKSALALIYRKNCNCKAPDILYAKRVDKTKVSLIFDNIYGRIYAFDAAPSLLPIFFEDDRGGISIKEYDMGKKNELLIELDRETEGICYVHGAYEKNPRGIAPIDTYSYLPMLSFYGVEVENQIPNTNWSDITSGLHGAFISGYRHYQKTVLPDVPEILTRSCIGWIGERLNTEILLWTNSGANHVKLAATALTNDAGYTIPAENLTLEFIRYVLSDDGGNGCGDNRERPTQLIADILDNTRQLDILNQQVVPVWVSVEIPHNAIAGIYIGNVMITQEGYPPLIFELSVEVLNVSLPSIDKWSYHHDQWQNPWAVARYYNVVPWSQAHWDYLVPCLKLARKGGQKVITTTIQKDPWKGHTYDPFDTMVKWTKKMDGTWDYDYSIFDNYVQLCLNLGIDKYINCYGMVPWGNRIFYYDENTDTEIAASATIGSSDWEAYWRSFLSSFYEHLIQKGWLSKTNIAMDEVAEADMAASTGLIKSIAPGLNIALAGYWHPAIEPELRDYSIGLGYLPANITDITEARRMAGKNTTFYVCCADPSPNNFVYSPPAESIWLGWHAAKLRVDGTLRWAFNSWVADPLADTRHSAFQAGDCFMVYPGDGASKDAASSVRWERICEGIQDYEKIQYLRANLDPIHLEQLEHVLLAFDKGPNYIETVEYGKQKLNEIIKDWLGEWKNEKERAIE